MVRDAGYETWLDQQSDLVSGPDGEVRDDGGVHLLRSGVLGVATPVCETAVAEALTARLAAAVDAVVEGDPAVRT